MMKLSGGSGDKMHSTGNLWVVESIRAATCGDCPEVLFRQRITLILCPKEAANSGNDPTKLLRRGCHGLLKLVRQRATDLRLRHVNWRSARMFNVRSREKLYRPCRSSARRGDFLGCDLVLEVVRVEAVEPAVGRFRLRIHEESDRCAVRSG
jgi:hypothetical protein